MGMVERVARAMARVAAEKRDRDEGGRGDGIDWLVSQTWKLRIPEARAAIGAMREPDDAMVKAGVEFAIYATVSGDGGWPRYVADKHRAMIDKALESGE